MKKMHGLRDRYWDGQKSGPNSGEMQGWEVSCWSDHGVWSSSELTCTCVSRRKDSKGVQGQIQGSVTV